MFHTDLAIGYIEAVFVEDAPETEEHEDSGLTGLRDEMDYECETCKGFGSIIIEPCDQLGGGCICESCTKQIN